MSLRGSRILPHDEPNLVIHIAHFAVPQQDDGSLRARVGAGTIRGLAHRTGVGRAT